MYRSLTPDDHIGSQETIHGKDQAAQSTYTHIPPSSEEDEDQDNDDKEAKREY